MQQQAVSTTAGERRVKCGLHISEEVMQLPLSIFERHVLAAIFQLKGENGSCWANYPHFANWLKLPKSTIAKCIRSLQDRGYLVKTGSYFHPHLVPVPSPSRTRCPQRAPKKATNGSTPEELISTPQVLPEQDSGSTPQVLTSTSQELTSTQQVLPSELEINKKLSLVQPAVATVKDIFEATEVSHPPENLPTGRLKADLVISACDAIADVTIAPAKAPKPKAEKKPKEKQNKTGLTDEQQMWMQKFQNKYPHPESHYKAYRVFKNLITSNRDFVAMMFALDDCIKTEAWQRYISAGTTILCTESVRWLSDAMWRFDPQYYKRADDYLARRNAPVFVSESAQ